VEARQEAKPQKSKTNKDKKKKVKGCYCRGCPANIRRVEILCETQPLNSQRTSTGALDLLGEEGEGGMRLAAGRDLCMMS